MTYSRRNIAEEQQEAQQKAQQITTICEQLHITLDPIDWQHSGMRARVTVDAIEISDLQDLSHQDSASILRHVQIKLLERAALITLCAQPGLKAVVWSPVEVVQPQAFVSLWIVMLETDERVAIVEYIRNGQRVYESYELDLHDERALAKLFGPLHPGAYQPGESVTIEEYGRQYSGEIVYVLPPSKVSATRKQPSRGRHTILGKIYPNDLSSRYLVNCHDGFPHVVNQWQIISETRER
ncbi:MAG: hypothetical protein J2P37_20435 [Ktedonobacteraceae bacterium]|nr:hypothetical protein [Ktedonobacteraceae bacterium]MBO0791724.1 hypothetical protein [Ktedonobacteraceae bacterium]